MVSGTDTENGHEQVTKLEYDKLGRLDEIRRGVSAAGVGADMTEDYDVDPTFGKVAAYYYDQPTPGSGTGGVGDGHVTHALAYYGETGAVETIFHHNWRGQLRGIEPEASPYIVQDVDNMGRATAVAQYTSEPTWTGETGVINDIDYAATVATNRRTLSKAKYDEMGACTAARSGPSIPATAVRTTCWSRTPTTTATPAWSALTHRPGAAWNPPTTEPADCTRPVS